MAAKAKAVAKRTPGKRLAVKPSRPPAPPPDPHAAVRDAHGEAVSRIERLADEADAMSPKDAAGDEGAKFMLRLRATDALAKARHGQSRLALEERHNRLQGGAPVQVLVAIQGLDNLGAQ